jgi:hypothetical protein
VSLGSESGVPDATSTACTSTYRSDAASSDPTIANGRSRCGARVSPAGTGTTSKPCAANSAMNVAEPTPDHPRGSSAERWAPEAPGASAHTSTTSTANFATVNRSTAIAPGLAPT